MYGTIARMRVRKGAEPLLRAQLEAHWKNAQSPNQDRRYHVIRSSLKSDPQWFDGEVLLHTERAVAARPAGGGAV
ncbi:MAG: hypothetical protein FJZ92_07790 [Chloroflexi bacterium]|nr:hypothetical protein [Chloroflexota bacterium]